MLIFNWSGLRRFYWFPKFSWNTDKKGLWYFSFLWLMVQVSLYSQKMGQCVVSVINLKSRN